MKKMQLDQPNWKKKLLWLGALGAALVAVISVILIAYIALVARKIDQRMAQLQNARATQFYALYPPFVLNQKFSQDEIESLLIDQGYVKRDGVRALSPGEYAFANSGAITRLELFRPPYEGPGQSIPQLRAELIFDRVQGELSLIEMVRTNGRVPIPSFANLPKRIGAFIGGRLRTASL